MTKQTATELMNLLKDQRKLFVTQMNFYESIIKKLIDQSLQNTTLNSTEEYSDANSNFSKIIPTLHTSEETFDEYDEEPQYASQNCSKLSGNYCYDDEEEYGGEDMDVEYFDRDEYLSEEYTESIREMSKSENDLLLKYESSDKHYFLD